MGGYSLVQGIILQGPYSTVLCPCTEAIYLTATFWELRQLTSMPADTRFRSPVGI